MKTAGGMDAPRSERAARAARRLTGTCRVAWGGPVPLGEQAAAATPSERGVGAEGRYDRPQPRRGEQRR